MLKNDLQVGLKNSKVSLLTAIEGRRRVVKQIREHKKLGIFDGNDRKRLLSHYRYYSDDVQRFRKYAMEYYRKLSAYNVLVGNEERNETTEKNIIPAKIPLEIENDFLESDYILESGEVTENYNNSRYYYKERVANNFVGTYPITVERLDDYEKFINTLLNDILISGNIIDFSISFDEWKNGYKMDGKRQIKLNKYLNKKGFSQYVLDFYSQQIRTEKTLYLTISDKVHHITGMSYYSTMKWTGMNGSSCQDPRHEYYEAVKLLASLHDNKLLIAFLHESLDDLKDMKKKMLARSMCRIIHVDGKQFLISTKHYGSMETIDELEKALRQLNCYGIFTLDQMYLTNNWRTHEERANGACELLHTEYIYVNEQFDDYVTCECPLCGGSGDYTAYTSNDREVEIDCPACGGSGEIETYVSIDVDEEIETEHEEEITPYNERYAHFGHTISIDINKDILGL